MPGTKTAIIVGGGIGGLTTAIALEQIGIKVTVLEQAKTFQEIGAGLWLWKNAMHAFELLGLADQVRNAGVQDAHGGIRTWRGEILVPRVPHQNDRVSVAILRSDLQKTLLSALNSERLQNNADCVNLVQDKQGVTVHINDGRELRADILIGADGIHSKIRANLFGTDSPIYAGFTAWRAVTPYAHDNVPAGVSWGPGLRFGVMPIIGDRVNWFAGRRMAAGTADAPAGRKHEIAELFRDWFDPIPALIDATNTTNIIRNDIYRVPRLRSWTKGRVTLLGDAAHAMTPSIGQGACQSIEDALDLAYCLRDSRAAVEALQRYEQRRMGRTRAVSRYARFMDTIGLWRNPVSSRLRNFAIHNAPDLVRDRQMNWILGYRAGR